MKKFISLIVSLFIVFTCLTGVNITAEKDTPFVLNISAEDGGEVVLSSYNNYTVTLKFTLTSVNGPFSQGFTVNSIINTDTGKAVSIKPNITYTPSQNLTVFNLGKADVEFSRVSVGGDVAFEINWTDEDGKDRTDTAYLKISNPNPLVSLTVTADNENSVPGGLVTLTYKLVNSGNVPVQYVTIFDETVASLSGRSCIYLPDRTANTLDIGKDITESVTIMVDSNVVSAPIVKYDFNGKTYEKKFDGLTVYVNEVLPTVSLSCMNYNVDKKGADQTFNYVIKNTTSVSLKDIRVYDSDTENANCVYGPFTLDADQSYSGSYVLPITKSGFYKFKISYSYEGADGTKEISAKTEYAVKFPNEVFLKIKNISPNSISEASDVIFSLSIENGTSEDLRELTISETANLMEPVSLGVILPAATSEGNAVLDRDVTVHIPASGTKLKFILSYKINDELYTTGIPYEVLFDSALSTPASENTPQTGGLSGDGKLSPILIWALAGILVLVLIAGVIVLLIFLKKRRSPDDAPIVVRKVNDVFDDDAYDDADGFDETAYDSDPYDVDSSSAGTPQNSSSSSVESIDSFDEIDDEGVKIYKKK